MNEQKTLAELKAGDEVAIEHGFSEKSYAILIIKSVSPRGIIELQNGNKYRSDGTPLEKGSRGFRPASLQVVTEDVRQANKATRLASKINGLNINDWKRMDVATLEAIAALIWKE